jgi:AcrR family transcriptional regulator
LTPQTEKHAPVRVTISKINLNADRGGPPRASRSSLAGVAKGPLYYQFDNKKALGYGVVDEIVASLTREKWVRPLQNAKNPIDTLIRIVQSTSLKPEDLQRGCPLNNLSQEISPLDAGFRERTAFEFPCLSPDRWRSC